MLKLSLAQKINLPHYQSIIKFNMKTEEFIKDSGWAKHGQEKVSLCGLMDLNTKGYGLTIIFKEKERFVMLMVTAIVDNSRIIVHKDRGNLTTKTVLFIKAAGSMVCSKDKD